MRGQRLIFALRDSSGYIHGSHLDRGELKYLPAATVALSLERMPVGDESIAQLPLLAGLRCVDLDGTNITDRSLAVLARLPQLEELWLEGTSITDAGFRELHVCKNLAFVSVAYTAVTEHAIRQLEEAVPGVEVET